MFEQVSIEFLKKVVQFYAEFRVFIDFNQRERYVLGLIFHRVLQRGADDLLGDMKKECRHCQVSNDFNHNIIHIIWLMVFF